MILQMMQQAVSNASSLVDLFYPNVCQSCGNTMQGSEEVICIHCQHQLPTTDYHKRADNPTAKHLWGRVLLENATSFLYFINGSKVQHLMHQLKYNAKTRIGIKIGQMYGKWLNETPAYQDIDMIVPVPLHPDKEKKRGYNQSFFFAMGLGDAMGVRYSKDYLFKTRNNESQTKKGRLDRWDNVKSVFRVQNEEELEGKHILLVDDVITTGSTLEACAHALREVGARVSVATMACKE